MFNSRRPTPAFVVALLALVVALAGTAGADPIATVARAIRGTTIKKRSLPGNRLRRDTLTGAEIKESKLGKVPKAKRADSAAKADTATKADSATKAGTATTAATATNAGHATSADSATNAGHASSADSATDAGTLDGIDSTQFVQGAGRRVVYRNEFGANTGLTKLFSVAHGGTLRGACSGTSVPSLNFINDTGATADDSIVLVTPSSPHAIVDYAQPPFANGTNVVIGANAFTWTIQVGFNIGRPQGALLTVSAFKEGTQCRFDVEGSSSLDMTFRPIL